MATNTSSDLRNHLRKYVQGEEKAFQSVARQLSGLIFHTAMRRSGDPSCAEEVVQIVFIQVSKKAAKLSKHPKLLAWVHEVSRLETLKLQRGELRRRKREEKVRITRGEGQTTDPHLLIDLDESMKVLRDSERELVLMKYLFWPYLEASSDNLHLSDWSVVWLGLIAGEQGVSSLWLRVSRKERR